MEYQKKFLYWLNSTNIDDEDRAELESIIDNDIEIRHRFSKELEFGTAGLRGVLGVGTDRINKYIVRKTTKGLAEHIKANGEQACARGVVIAHDNRRKSREFCIETACVLAANGIRSYIFDDLRPTPELSFAVRYLNAFSGVMITASHNPPEYNGYKLYDEKGCQLVPEATDLIIKHIEKIDDPLSVETISFEEAADLITFIGEDVDENYYAAVMGISVSPDLPKNIKIVYSPQHGTGNIPVRTVLERMGYTVIPVLEQCVSDPDFSATINPNPELAEAYSLALDYARASDAELVITTDPDCDRLGVAIKHNGDYIRMTGNQSAAVLLEYILSQKAKTNDIPDNAIMFNTVVTSDLGDRICRKYGVDVEKTLTGFKYIGDKIHQHNKIGDKKFIFGYEESYGCLISDFVRDKDGVQASLMLCEAAAYYHEQGLTLVDVLNQLYYEYGYFLDALDNFYFKGIDGSKIISDLVNDLRQNPPASVTDISVVEIEDFESDAKMAEGFPRSNVLRFILADGSWVAVRPSGTEPKCKFYFSVVAKDEAAAKIKLDEIRAVFEKDCK